MPLSVRYPQEVELVDGTVISATDDTWRERHLVVETDRSEEEVRDVLYEEGFEETDMEFRKSGSLGRGMVRKHKDWQAHVRFFPHDGNIQIDGEVEVSKKYVEHLTHDWLPALDLCADIIWKHFGSFLVYHKKYRQYVADLDFERTLKLGDPKSKTSAAGLVAGIALGAIAVGLLAAASKK